MRTHRTLYLLAVVAAFTGCRSNGGAGWSVWNPFSQWGQDTAVANSMPELPSRQFADASKSPASTSNTAVARATPGAGRATTSAPAYTPPAAVARAAEATPTAANTVAGSAPNDARSASSETTPTSPAISAVASGTPSAGAAAAGPYDPNGYQPTTTSAAPGGASGVNRYGMPDRYAMTAPTSAPSPTNEATAPNTSTYPGGDRYATFETPAAASPPSATTASPAATPQVEPTAAMVNLTTPPGQYRPAGTSSYPTADLEQVNVASRPEKATSTTPVAPAPSNPAPRYPSTETPETNSIYDKPAYR